MSEPAHGTVVTVTSRIERELAPELGTIRLAVAFDGRQRGPVLERCTQVAAKVHASLEALGDEHGSPLTDWSQSQTAVWTDRPWNAEGNQLPLVYHAQVEFAATFSDLTELTTWLAVASAREGVTISGIEWRLTDASRHAATAEARTAAVAEARATADDYAAALGLRVAAAIEVADHGMLSTGSASPVYAEYQSKRAMLADAGAMPPMRPAPVIVEAAVDARFLAQ